jgi:hypothetical protein
MQPRQKIVFLTADHLDEQADALRNAAQLRTYASTKRALAPQIARLN